AELTNAWVELAMKGARDELIKNFQVSITDKLKKLGDEVGMKKRLALSQLDMELLKLREAQRIADQNGFVDPVDLATEGL
ncbi:MAG: hypothetical protein V7776_23620, partial [Halopseudomonas aestusnigri]